MIGFEFPDEVRSVGITRFHVIWERRFYDDCDTRR